MNSSFPFADFTDADKASLFSANVLSMLASLFIIVTYIAYPPLRRQPNGLIVSRSCCDFVLGLTWSVTARERGTCQDPTGRLSAFVTQFSLLCAELFYACLAVDLLRNMNPFSDSARNNRLYRRWCIAIASLFAFVLVSNDGFYGETFLPGVCWIKYNGSSAAINMDTVYFFYAPLLCCYVFSVFALVRVSVFLSKAVASNATVMGPRLEVIREGRRYVIYHGLYWALAFCLYVPYVNIGDRSGPNDILFCFVCFIIGLRAVENLAVWLPLVLSIRAGEALAFSSDQEMNPQLNEVLQQDVLHFTVKGMAEVLSGQGVVTRTFSSDGATSERTALDLAAAVPAAGVPRNEGSSDSACSVQTNRNRGLSLGTDPDSVCVPIPGPTSPMERLRRTFQQSSAPSRMHSSRSVALGAAGSEQLRGRSKKPSLGSSFGSKRPKPGLLGTPGLESPTPNPNPRPLLAASPSSDGPDPVAAAAAAAAAVTNDVEAGVVTDDSTMRNIGKGLRSKRIEEFLLATYAGAPLVLGCMVATISALALRGGDSSSTWIAVVGTSAIVVFISSMAGWYVISVRWERSRERAFITEYAPKQFAHVRDALGIETADFVHSLRLADPRYLDEGKVGDAKRAGSAFNVSGGRSGALMFFSGDDKYIIKTVTNEERMLLLDFMPDLIKYFELTDANGVPNFRSSLLARIYGLFSLQIYGHTFHYIVLQNILPTIGGVVDARYDLKGSWVSRNGKKPSVGKVYVCSKCGKPFAYGNREDSFCRLNKVHIPRRLLKDNDLGYKVLLPMQDARRLKSQLRSDVERVWLASQGIMDYSLLLGVTRRYLRVRNRPAPLSKPALKRSISDVESPASLSSTNGRERNNREGGSGYDVRSAIDNTREFNSTRFSAWDEKLSSYAPLLVEGPSQYYLGIIDYMQRWTWSKRLEHFAKVWLMLNNDTDENGYLGVSAVNPTMYKRRFLDRAVDALFPELNDIVEVLLDDGSVVATLDVSSVGSYDDLWDLVASNSDNLPAGVGMFLDRDGSWRGGRRNDTAGLVQILPHSFRDFRETCRQNEITKIILRVMK